MFEVSVFVKSVILICYLLRRKKQTCLWIPDLKNFNLLLSLCRVKQNGCLYARMRVCIDRFFFFSFLKKFLFNFFFFLANLRPLSCLIVMNIKTMIILVDVTIMNYYQVLDARLLLCVSFLCVLYLV